jgi:uncharacterized protein (TIGR03083 family)
MATVAEQYFEEYDAVRLRLTSLVQPRDQDTPVAACPNWRVRDVLGHMTGVCEDWLNHHLDQYATEAWTDDQVSRYQALTISDLLQRWASLAAAFARLDEPIMGQPPARWAFGDAVIHEADIRGALGNGRVPDDAVQLSLRNTLARWHREVLKPAGFETVHVQLTDGPEQWLGQHDDPGAPRLEVPTHELFRGLAGRRSIQQARDWVWSIDPEPILRLGLPYPFRWANSGLAD